MSNSTWAKLSQINVNEFVEKKPNGCTYLSWAWAWGVTKEQCPDASYRVINFYGKPWCFDEYLGYMVQTEVTINGETLPMHLFVMDGANKAQRHVDYQYTVKSGTKSVNAATMFDINTAIMRCLTKNLAMFVLGHYIYAGEDLPVESEDVKKEKFEADLLTWKGLINGRTSIPLLNELWKTIPIDFKALLKTTASARKDELKKLEGAQ
jgi:hypothetical protein